MKPLSTATALGASALLPGAGPGQPYVERPAFGREGVFAAERSSVRALNAIAETFSTMSDISRFRAAITMRPKRI